MDDKEHEAYGAMVHRGLRERDMGQETWDRCWMEAANRDEAALLREMVRQWKAREQVWSPPVVKEEKIAPWWSAVDYEEDGQDRGY